MSNNLGSRLLAGFALVTAAALLPVTAASAATSAPADGAIRDGGAADNIPGSYIVVLKDGVAASGVSASATAMTAGVDATVTRTYDTVLNGFAATMSEKAARRLAADPSVAYVTPDRVVRASGTVTDPVWGLDRIDERDRSLSGTYTYGSASDVTIYVLDSGVRMSHEEFGGRARSGPDFVDGDRDASDCYGHGTHVAATAAGKKYGVAKDAKIVSVRVLDCNGNGRYSTIIAGVDWITGHAAKPAVVTMSLGGRPFAGLDRAVERSIASGVTYTVAAGNENSDACGVSPARTGAAITVAATDIRDARAGYSNYGRCVDIFAPGTGIKSAGHRSDTATKTMKGTSMATPHVAGAAALYLGEHPGATPNEVRDALVANATTGVITDAHGSPNRLIYTGS